MSIKNSLTIRWLSRLLKYVLYFILTITVLISIVLVFLPAIVSTDWSHQFIQDKLSDALNRSLIIQQLNWSWSDGIIINNVMIPDLPEFSGKALLFLKHVTLKPDINKLLHRKVRLEIVVAELDVNIIKNANGKLNIETLGKKKEKPTAPAEKEKKETHKKDEKAVTLPSIIKDVSTDVRLTGINLNYDDQVKKETYQINNLELLLDAPSLKSAPVKLTIGTDIHINQTAIPRSTISAVATNLFNNDDSFNINGLSAQINADLSGIDATAAMDMDASEIEAGIDIDLASLMDAAGPMIPGIPDPTDISGSVKVTAATGIGTDDPLAFDASFSGSNLSVSGKLIGGKSVGPGSFSVHLNGVGDLQAEKLNLKTADIVILENSRIHLSATIDQLKSDDRKIHLAVSPLYLDVDEITSFAAPFIPPAINIDSPAGNNGYISLTGLQINGQLPTGAADIKLKGLKSHLPEIAVKDHIDDNPVLSISESRIHLKNLNAHLSDLFPESAAFTLSLAVDKLISGKREQAISMSGVRLEQFNANVGQLAKTDASKFGISGNFSLDNRLHIQQIKLPGLIRINDITQSLKFHADLQKDSAINASLEYLDVFCNRVDLLNEDIGPINTSAEIHLAVEDVFLKNPDPLTVDICNLVTRVTLADALNIAIAADVVDSADTSFTADIKIESDLEALTGIMPDRLRRGISGAGNLSINLNAAGRRPEQKETEALSKMEFTGNLSFLDHLKMQIDIDNGGMEIPRHDNDSITIASLTANPLVQYSLNGKTGKGELTGVISTGALTGLPGINPGSPLSGRFSVFVGHKFLSSIDLNQSLAIAPAGVEETIDISIDGMEKIVSRKPLPELPELLLELGADISVGLKIPESQLISELGIPGMSETNFSGMAEAGFFFQLIPAQSINGGVSLTARDMNIAMPETVSAENIDANIDFTKSYLIRSSERQAAIVPTSGLSMDVLDSDSTTAMVSQNTDIHRHIRRLHERMNPNPTLSFRTAHVMAAPFPLIIDESMIMLNLTKGLPNLDYFQFNLLGGTVNGSVALVDEKTNKKQPFKISTALTFSGINTAQIFPQAFSKENYSKADISGALYADVPVTDRIQDILENSAVTIEFTRIGSRALERLLYALDPYESNEAIVTQRQLLKNGSPENVRAEIRDGSLTLGGKVSVKGFDIDLPTIRRLNIAQIPGMERFEKPLAGLTPIIELLHKISAERIVINKETNTMVFE